MRGLRFFLKVSLMFIFLFGVLIFLVFNYSWIFSETVKGEIIELERIPGENLGGATEAQPSSYVILLQNEAGFMYTFSADDRQWQVAKKGYCVMATLYRYPPWNLEKGGTFYNAQLKQIYKCPEKDTSDTSL